MSNWKMGLTTKVKKPTGNCQKQDNCTYSLHLPLEWRDAFEAQKMIDIGLAGMRDYTVWMRKTYGASLSIDAEWETMKFYQAQAARDMQVLQALDYRSQLGASEKQRVEQIKKTWREAIVQAQEMGGNGSLDLERPLLDYMEQHQGEFYKGGGVASSDTVPAMLTPGEYVVNRQAVSRLGVGFLEALNNLSVPAKAMGQMVAQGLQGVQGFSTGGLVMDARIGATSTYGSSGLDVSGLDLSTFNRTAQPSRTVRVELASGNRSVNATVDAQDESRLLDLLRLAQARSS